jgi:tRNA-specific 2-thiouridylase
MGRSPIGMKILIAMSGGVDSSVAAFILQKQNKNCVGAMMKLYTNDDLSPMYASKTCCSLEDVEDARQVAASMNMPFYVFNFTAVFAETVMERFVLAYKRGQTPNPCIDCNRFMKFERFMQRAMELDCTHIATGHYARVEPDTNGRHLLKTGLDETKDQSYVLYSMTQTQLSRTLFPLGGLTKEEVRKIAEEQGFVNAKKRDSQDICFAPDGDYASFIERHTGEQIPPGNFINSRGEIIGSHKGIIHYTIGQRKGLGISAPHPLFVLKLNTQDNTVTLGSSEELFAKTLKARDINLIPFEKLNGSLKVQAKIRYSHKAQPATLRQTGEDEIHIEFDSPQRAITPGQAVVMYDGDIVIGGGTIT